MESKLWSDLLHALYQEACQRYKRGERRADTMFSAEERAFLASIGLRSIHLFDYAEDFVGSGEPTWDTVLLLAAERRGVFLFEQAGQWSECQLQSEALPPKDAAVDGVRWLPRIIPKAQGFLRGELSSDIMYSCGGDRAFFRRHGIHGADFLKLVRHAGPFVTPLALLKELRNWPSWREESSPKQAAQVGETPSSAQETPSQTVNLSLTSASESFTAKPMTETIAYSRKNPFPATLGVNRKLTLEGSEKDTRHFEIDLKNSGLTYEVGDSLGVFPKNDLALVEELIAVAKLDPAEQVPGNDGTPKPLREALMTDYQITQPDKKLLKLLAEKDPTAQPLLELTEPANKAQLDDFFWGREVLDLLMTYPAAQITAAELVGVLRKLQPRLYSIASSQRAVGDSVHLTVALVEYETFGRKRKGVCSNFLAFGAADPSSVPVFVHTAKHFRLPEDPATPVIMVGPGTGIAPFRAFLQERKATGATGKNWLIFGEQRAACDFFYKDEWEGYQAEGVLQRLDTAFSRDQAHKIYVQHRILEAAPELYEWLENGAYFYVCGDAQRMAKDVDEALHRVIENAGGKTPEEAKAYVEDLKATKRYRKDVY